MKTKDPKRCIWCGKPNIRPLENRKGWMRCRDCGAEWMAERKQAEMFVETAAK